MNDSIKLIPTIMRFRCLDANKAKPKNKSNAASGLIKKHKFFKEIINFNIKR